MNTIVNLNTSTQVLNQKAVLSALESNLAMIEFNLNKKVIWVNDNFAQTLVTLLVRWKIYPIVNSVLKNIKTVNNMLSY